MEARVLKAIERFSLINKGETVTVALSGGADSMSLLHILLKLKETLGITVNAAHLNHMIRGEEALRDEQFVKEQCSELGVQLFTRQIDVPKYAVQNGMSLELAARELRYEFLKEVAVGKVATAHNANDNLETVIFNLSRGSGLEGLCGIPTKRDIFIRPLILCERELIEKYCEDNGISFVTDSTNLSDEYTRNKIRHNIIPFIKELNPSAESAILRTTSILREAAALIGKLSDKYLKDNMLSNGNLSLKGLNELEPIVAKEVLRSFAESKPFSIALQNVHIEKLYSVAINGGKTSLPKDCYAKASNDILVVKKENDEEKIEFSLEMTEIFPPFFEKSEKINNLLLKSLIDCDKIVGKLVRRNRLPSDKIRLLNRGCTKSLKDLLSEEKIPLGERKILPLLADDKGIVWVYGLGVAERCAVSGKTQKAIKVDAKREVLK